MAALLALAVPLWAETRVVGTDLLGPEFSKAVYGFAVRARTPVALALDGSRPGIEELKAGRADLALVVLPKEELAELRDFYQQPIAYHRVVVWMPRDCPLREITLPQLASIFSKRAPAATKRWSDLSAGGPWADRAIVTAAPSAGLTLEYFRHVVLNGDELQPNVMRYRDNQELVALFAGEAAALTLAASVPPNTGAIRVLPVASREGATAFLPTEEHVHAGDYPLALALRVVARPAEITRLRPLMEWFSGPEAAAEFERAGLAPLPAAARAAVPDARKKER